MAQLMQWFWIQEYWLPPGLTWEDMKEPEGVHYPQSHHLLLCLPIILLLVALRFSFERNICIPLSKKLGMQEKVRQKPSPNPILEAFYTKRRKSPQKEDIGGLAKQCDLQPRQVERWFRYRRNQDRPSLTKKFSEASWRATYHVIFFSVGLAILYDKPWFWDLREVWAGYPKQPLQLNLSAYYLVQFSYCSLILMQSFDVRHKDFHQQIVHHVLTMVLIGFSYCMNCIRIGTLIMFLADSTHFLLFATKMFNYLKWEKSTNILFIVFSAMFLFTRMVIFPFKILHNTYYYSMEIYQPFLAYYVFNAFLMILQLFHIWWSYLIFSTAYQILVHGTIKKDVQSDSEGNEEDEEDEDELGREGRAEEHQFKLPAC